MESEDAVTINIRRILDWAALYCIIIGAAIVSLVSLTILLGGNPDSPLLAIIFGAVMLLGGICILVGARGVLDG